MIKLRISPFLLFFIMLAAHLGVQNAGAEAVLFDHVFDGINGAPADPTVWSEVFASSGTAELNGSGQYVMHGIGQFNSTQITSVNGVVPGATTHDYEVEYQVKIPTGPNIFYLGLRSTGSSTTQGDWRGFFLDGSNVCNGAVAAIRLNCDQGGSGCGLGGCAAPTSNDGIGYALDQFIGLKIILRQTGLVEYFYNPDVLGSGTYAQLTPGAAALGAGLDTWPVNNSGFSNYKIMIDCNACCGANKDLIVDRIVVKDLTVPVELSSFKAE